MRGPLKLGELVVGFGPGFCFVEQLALMLKHLIGTDDQ
jgi:hypothetical protein